MSDVFSVIQRRQDEGRGAAVAFVLAACDISGLTRLYEAVMGRDSHDGHDLTDQERYERGMRAVQELTATAVILKSGLAWFDHVTGGFRPQLPWAGGATKQIADPAAEIARDAPQARRLVHGANWGIVRSLATWSLPIAHEGPLEVLVHRTARAVGDFGEIAYAEVTTNPDGADDEGHGWSGPVHRFDPMLDWLRVHGPAVRRLSFELAVDIPGLNRPLHGAASLVLDKVGSGRWTLTLAVHTNVYSPVARPDGADNSKLSAVLAPRLRAMMARASEAFGPPWTLVAAPGYTDLLDDGGFFARRPEVSALAVRDA